MARYEIVGYCPALAMVLEEACYNKVPYEHCDESPPFPVWRAQSERKRFWGDLERAFVDVDLLDREYEHVMDEMYHAILTCEDDDLKEMVLRGTLKHLDVDKRGYYRAIEE